MDRQVKIRALISPIIIILIVFGSAGRIFWQGVVYCGLTFIILGITYLTTRNNPELINERLKPGHGMKGWDKVYYILSTPLYFTAMILAGLDVGRFKLSSELSMPLYMVSVLVFLLGHVIFMWARRTNNYFSSVVRIQRERGHKVCDTGPYKYIRHPGYLGGLLWNAATPVILGFNWALIPTGMAIVLMIVRAILEDNTLKRELEGYREYRKKVRYKLIPFIW